MCDSKCGGDLPLHCNAVLQCYSVTGVRCARISSVLSQSSQPLTPDCCRPAAARNTTLRTLTDPAQVRPGDNNCNQQHEARGI